MTRGIDIVAAAGTTLLVTLLAALPWGLSPSWRFFLPQLPFLIIYLWTAKDAAVLPPFLILAAGLLLDVSSGGPLGFWAFAYLAGYVLSGIAWPLPGVSPGRLIHFSLTIALLMAFEWGVSSLYYLAPADLDPFLRALVGAWLSFPIIRFGFAWFFGRGPEISNSILARGR